MAQERKAGPPAKFPASLIERKQSEAQMPQFVSAVWRDLRQEGVDLPRQVVVWGNDWYQQFEVWEADSTVRFNYWQMTPRLKNYRLAQLVADRPDSGNLRELTVIDVADADPIGPEEVTGNEVFDWGKKGILATGPVEVYVVDGRKE